MSSYEIRTWILGILPAECGVGWVSEEVPEGFRLHPDEAACLSPKAWPKRRKEFAMGRAAAHEALTQIGMDIPAIVKDASGIPEWPTDVVGSISHKSDAALAVVAPKSRLRALGIDVESTASPLTMDISKRICTPEEMEWVHEKDSILDFRIKTIFSAKEAVYKAVFPYTGTPLSFHDVTLTLHSNGIFTITPTSDKAAAIFTPNPYRLHSTTISSYIISLCFLKF